MRAVILVAALIAATPAFAATCEFPLEQDKQTMKTVIESGRIGPGFVATADNTPAVDAFMTQVVKALGEPTKFKRVDVKSVMIVVLGASPTALIGFYDAAACRLDRVKIPVQAITDALDSIPDEPRLEPNGLSRGEAQRWGAGNYLRLI